MTNHSLGFVPAVHIQQDQLDLCFPGFGEDHFEVCAGLIISDVELNRKPASSQAWHDGIEGWATMFIHLCLEGLL